MLMLLAALLHWWNPLVWKLRRDFEQVCECSCDETVMQNTTDEEVEEYLRLMIEEAREKKDEDASLRWNAGFGDNAQKIKERMENLMNKKKWNRTAAVTLVAVLAFANSMTGVWVWGLVRGERVTAVFSVVGVETPDSGTFFFFS